MEKPKRLAISGAPAVLTQALKTRWAEYHAPRRFYDTMTSTAPPPKPPSRITTPNCARHCRYRVKHNGNAFVYPQGRRTTLAMKGK